MHFFIPLLILFISTSAHAENWNCTGRSVSIVSYKNRIEVKNYGVSTDEKSEQPDSLLKAVKTVEELFDKKSQIKNVCNFQSVVDPASLRTRLSWIYTLTWKTKDGSGIAQSEIPLDMDNSDEFDAKILKIMQRDTFPNFFVITTLCTYSCH